MRRLSWALLFLLLLWLAVPVLAQPSSTTPDAVLLQAQRAEQQANFPEAERLYRQVIERSGSSPLAAEAKLRLAALYMRKLERYNDAQKLYEELIKEYRTGEVAAEAALRLGEIYELQMQKATDPKERNALEQQALEAYRRVERDFGDTAVARGEGKQRLDALLRRIDERHRNHPAYRFWDILVALTGRQPWLSYWVAIVLFTLIVIALLTPLRVAWFRSMREMKKLEPEVRRLRERYKGQELNEKIMQLYKEHKVNPAAGCLPMLVQIPILIYLYYTIRMYEYQFGKGFFLWINPWMAERFPGIVGANLGQHDLPLLILYAISLYVTQRLTPVSDPAQAEQMKFTSLFMTIFMMYMMYIWRFPSAFVLYWFLSNILMTAQQLYYMKQEPVPAATTSPSVEEKEKTPEPVPAATAASNPGKSHSARKPRRRR
ncbi:MAG: membrane protein insertase YidC [Armatimonadota bacterium]|nr:membrane protein insertase YidC [bacterium]MDW8103918.1 membrane protein insertase YidC [Armatimonadota bacterium]MDW8289653.1 membrane protein insertase YidC [Armatimonadota bacterium]